MTKASTHEAEAKSRAEELNALAEAKKVIEEATGSAALTQTSFIQVARSKVSQGSFKVVRLIRDLAQKQGSGALMQLVSRMSSAMDSKDSFAKIKGLISEMIARLEKEAGEDATKKAYCDKELSETSAKKAEKSNEIAKLSTRIDRMVAKSAQLKEEVAAIQNQLAELAKSQASMDKLRGEENAAFVASKAELEKGITGLKLALKILNEYYGSTEKAAAEQDVKYKSKESSNLDKTSGELSADRSGVQAELDAVADYLSKIESECIEKAETYASRTSRREAELAGLKEALQILESETALIQQRASRHTFRGRMHLSIEQ